jgi:phage terminase large subunit-like protein
MGRAGVTGSIDTAQIKHSSGGLSLLGFKSYDQKRQSFQGTAKHVIWLDEEPPMDVYSECMLRTMTTNGLMLCTFTPLLGLSDVALMYLPELTGDC